MSWHWIFLINIPFGVLGVAAALHYIEADKPTVASHPLDVIGFIWLALGLVGIIGSLETLGKNLLPWPVIATAVGVGTLSLLTYVRHSRTCPHPLIDLAIFRFTSYRASVLGGMPARIAIIGAAPFLLPLMFQLGFGLSPLNSGWLTMATAIGALGTRLIIKRMIRAIGFRSVLIVATILNSVFFVAYALFTPHTSHTTIFVVLLGSGLVTAMVLISLLTLGFTEIPKDRMSHATTAAGMAQQLSICLGVVLGASLLSLIGALRGDVNPSADASNFVPTFIIVAIVTLSSVYWFRQMRSDEGDEFSERQ
jgi:MFS family permease